MNDFFMENDADLRKFAAMSQSVGRRCDYVQGGGGNTSVKLSDGLMAIKASGYCLKDITERNAYAVLNGKAIKTFFQDHSLSDFADAEKEGAAFVKEQIKVIEGLPQLRPSVEAGFHSLLDRFVIHSHSVYANLAACTDECRDIITKAFDGASYAWGLVPYVDPGVQLSFYIRDEINRVESTCGMKPAVIVMQNHGLIVHSDEEETCLSLHEDANKRLASVFGLDEDVYPKVSIAEEKEGLLHSNTAYVKEQLLSGDYSLNQLLKEPLYPDQLVFFTGTLGESVEIDWGTGAVDYHLPKKTAETMEETLTAVLFIMDHIRQAGYHLATMGDAAKAFIANWESEKYRKGLAGGSDT